MASQFIGYTVLVTLVSPPNAQLQGIVTDVINKRLELRDGEITKELQWRMMADIRSASFGHWPILPYLQCRRLSNRRPRGLSAATKWAPLQACYGTGYAFRRGGQSRPARATTNRASFSPSTTEGFSTTFRGPSDTEFHQTYERHKRCGSCQTGVNPTPDLVPCHDCRQHEAE